MNVNDYSLVEYDEGNYAIRVPRPWVVSTRWWMAASGKRSFT